jgi:hypothetical protein
MFGIAQRSRLGVSFALLFPSAGGLQNTETFGVSGHDAVFDTVVNHFDQVPSAIGTAMKITLFGGA